MGEIAHLAVGHAGDEGAGVDESVVRLARHRVEQRDDRPVLRNE